jgi:hypothetical protein
MAMNAGPPGSAGPGSTVVNVYRPARSVAARPQPVKV